jgi:hypothetical protein
MIKNINWFDHFLNFVAVILGVLLAFQIGSLTETFKEKQELKEILQSFIQDIERNQETFNDFQIPENKKQSDAIGELLAILVDNQLDSLNDQLSVAFNVQNYSPISSTHLSVTSSGKIGLIKDFEVKKAISKYYNILAKESIKKGEIQVEFLLKEIIPWMIENTTFLDLELEDVAEDIKFANRLVIYKSLIDNKIEQYKLISKDSEELKNALMDLLNQ